MKLSMLVWPAVITGSSLGIGLIVMGGLISPIRPLIAFWFMLVCPGMAIVRLLGIEDRVKELTLAIALSLALDCVLAVAMVYTRLWSPELGLGILIGISLIGSFLQMINAHPRKRRNSGSCQ